ncbi:MAG: hypothetical protein FJ221_18000 [Lentisphaerae bacterium]|nr:hypothetical protein [Lentisphaerota bacterium]
MKRPVSRWGRCGPRVAATMLATTLGLAAGGCGRRAGTWSDDPGNWRRIFQGPKPAKVEMVHSWYWRSPHFTMEFEYFVVIASNGTFWADLTRDGALEAVTDPAAREASTNGFFHARPAWFAPGPLEDYDILRFAREPRQNFRVLRHRATGTVHLHDGVL